MAENEKVEPEEFQAIENSDATASVDGAVKSEKDRQVFSEEDAEVNLQIYVQYSRSRACGTTQNWQTKFDATAENIRGGEKSL